MFLGRKTILRRLSMKCVKHGGLLLVVMVALFVASLGASFGGLTESQNGVTVESTFQVTKDGSYLIGATGLHW
jgi:hypothetical protein